jgi:hypothetical protein
MKIRGNACPISLHVIEDVPSPCDTDETINLSKLNITNAHIKPKIIAFRTANKFKSSPELKDPVEKTV